MRVYDGIKHKDKSAETKNQCGTRYTVLVPGKKHPETGIRKIYGRKSVHITNSPPSYFRILLAGGGGQVTVPFDPASAASRQTSHNGLPALAAARVSLPTSPEAR